MPHAAEDILSVTRSLSFVTDQCDLCWRAEVRDKQGRVPHSPCLMFAYDNETVFICPKHLRLLADALEKGAKP